MEPVVIKPTIGRVVWFVPNGARLPRHFTTHGDQPCKADIAYVHGDRMVNLLIVDHAGVTMPMTSVRLMQKGDEHPTEGQAFCMWMPYQQGQAERTQQLESKLADTSKPGPLQPPPNPPAESAPAPRSTDAQS